MTSAPAGMTGDTITAGIVQMAPVWLDSTQTLEKRVQFTAQAGREKCAIIALGEALLPGYPFLIGLTDGARFNSPVQLEIHAHYADQAVQLKAGHLEPLCRAAATNRLLMYAGCIERPADRGGHSRRILIHGRL